MRHRRRHNPFLAEFGLGNPRKHHARHRGHHGRYRHNPAMAGILQHPAKVITPALWAGAGIIVPTTVANFLAGMFGGSFPALAGTDMIGVVMRAALRGVVAWASDVYLIRTVIHGEDLTGYRVGAGLAVIGGPVLTFIGRPLIIGPGDQSLWLGYPFTAAPAVTAGVGSYTRAPYVQGARSIGEYTRAPYVGARSADALRSMFTTV